MKIRGKDVYDSDSVLTDIDWVIVGVGEWEKRVWRRGLVGTKLDIQAGTGIVGGHGVCAHKGTRNRAFRCSVARARSGPSPNSQSNLI